MTFQAPITRCSIPDRWTEKWFGGKYKRIDVLFSTVVLPFWIIDIVASIKEIYFLHFQTQSQCGLDEIGTCCQCTSSFPTPSSQTHFEYCIIIFNRKWRRLSIQSPNRSWMSLVPLQHFLHDGHANCVWDDIPHHTVCEQHCVQGIGHRTNRSGSLLIDSDFQNL